MSSTTRSVTTPKKSGQRKPRPKTPAATFASYIKGECDWARDIIDRAVVAADGQRLLDDVDRITQRAADPALYLSVFGEFSAGKSTLLNALLGTDMLPTSSMVTTSVPTVLRAGDEARLEVCLAETGDWLRFGDPEFGTWYRRVTGRAAPKTMKTLLKNLLTVDAVATTILEIDASVQHSLLPSQMVLIDTPGMNSTDARHRELAASVVRSTDIAIVVVPATAPVSLTLVDFLNESLEGHLERCVFVLTKGRLIDPDERGDVLRWTARRLADAGVPDPVMMEAESADEALKCLASGRRDDPRIVELRGLADSLSRFAQDHHQESVEASLRILMSDMLAALADASRAERARLTAAENQLADVRVTNFESFLGHWQASTLSAVRGAVYDVARPYDFGRGGVEKVAVERIGAAESAKAFKELSGQLPELVNGAIGNAARGIVSARQESSTALARRRLVSLESDFRREYGKLSKLVGQAKIEVKVPTAEIKGIVDGVDIVAALSSTSATARDLRTKQNWKRGFGVYGGAVVGTLIAPGLGTVIGGLLGAGAGTVTAANRAKMTASVQTALTNAEREVSAAVDASLDHMYAEMARDVERVVNAYRRQCGPLIDTLLGEERQQRAELRSRIGYVSEVIDQTAIRRDRLAGSIQ